MLSPAMDTVTVDGVQYVRLPTPAPPSEAASDAGQPPAAESDGGQLPAAGETEDPEREAES